MFVPTVHTQVGGGAGVPTLVPTSFPCWSLWVKASWGVSTHRPWQMLGSSRDGPFRISPAGALWGKPCTAAALAQRTQCPRPQDEGGAAAEPQEKDRREEILTRGLSIPATPLLFFGTRD